MPSRGKKTADDLDASQQSDPEDDDYGTKPKRRVGASKTASPQKRKAARDGSRGRQPKRARRRASDHDIVGDDESPVYDSDEEDQVSDDSDNPVKAGRSTRRATQIATYEEPPTEDEDDIDEKDEVISEEEISHAQSRLNSARAKSDIITLHGVMIEGGQAVLSSTKSIRVGAPLARRKGSGVPMARRRGRWSHDEVTPLMPLGDSGDREEIIREGSADNSPEENVRRPSVARKSVLQGPIIEESQEDPNEPLVVKGHIRNPESTSPKPPELQDLGEAMSDAPLNLLDDGGGKNDDLVAESVHDVGNAVEEDDDDEEPVVRPQRQSRRIQAQSAARSRRGPKGSRDESSDFDPEEHDDGGDIAMSQSDNSRSPHKASQRSEVSSNGRKSRRTTRRSRGSRRPSVSEESELQIDPDELRLEAADLKEAKRRRKSNPITYDNEKQLRRRREKVDYRIYRPELLAPNDDDEPTVSVPMPSLRGRRNIRSLFSTLGPFGGAGGPVPLFSGAADAITGARLESDSSDDDGAQKANRTAGMVGMTPSTMRAPSLFPHNLAVPDKSAAATTLGKVNRDPKALAEIDPLGVDQCVTFEGVGGLENHINQLKEMVGIPLLYPEIFQSKHMTPPRGVLFYGPPGTGKTLLARALASSLSSHNQKVTFYMRKGADTLSKWVGEAERQLKLLFEDARKNQPSIIFFDEIDGLAPVRSAKQDQIHSSIVTTLLALMDGMDGRGQVIIIGATNRPDSVDSALRRPGRFDREFYFPLPDQQGRRAIIDIHTKGWEPALESGLKDQLAAVTAGYGGADLRALCTEAALNAVQGTYPQIYQSYKKLAIDVSKIKVLAKDFMISVKKMVPSSERSAPSLAAALEDSVEPLLREALNRISKILEEVFPEKKRLTALQEAEFDDRDDNAGFDREIREQRFERARVYRPRLLIHGHQGMGQQYLGKAVLRKFERVHMQSLDLSIIYGNTGSSPEAMIVQSFNEAARHKPSIIYIPNVNLWYDTVGLSVVRLFTGLLRSVSPNDQMLVLGIMEWADGEDRPPENMLRDLFGFSVKSHFEVFRPTLAQRREFFGKVISLIEIPPDQFLDPENRKRRILPQLEEVPADPEPAREEPSRQELRDQRKRDRHILNLLKLGLQPLMSVIKQSHKKFRTPIIDDSIIEYLFHEKNPAQLTTDLGEEQAQQHQYRPFEVDKDRKGEPGLREIGTGRFFYNLDTALMERRISNGYYKRPRDFVADVKRLGKDAKTLEDQERTIKANELLTVVEVEMQRLEHDNPGLTEACEQVHTREQEREALRLEKEREAREKGQSVPHITPNVPALAQHSADTTEQSSGPVVLGERMPGRPHLPTMNGTLTYPLGAWSNGFFPHDPPRFSLAPSNASNGEDVHMSNSDERDHAVPAPYEHGLAQTDVTAAPQRERDAQTHVQHSQRSAVTHMAHNSQPADYHNSASTTTSGQKTDKSHHSSGPQGHNNHSNSHGTNGLHRGEHPDWDELHLMSGGSRMPDTQEMLESSSQSVPSPPRQPIQLSPWSSQTKPPQAMPPPPSRGATDLNSILNAEPPPHPPTVVSVGVPAAAEAAPPKPRLLLSPDQLAAFLAECVDKTSGCSVEQLEQINAALMSCVWKMRADWNRDRVIGAAGLAFNSAMADMEAVQPILPASGEGIGGELGRAAR